MNKQLPSISVDLIQQFIVHGEGADVEFKTVVREPSLLARIIASFANAEGGFILVGVREPGEIIGTDMRLLTRMYDATLPLLSPRPQCTVKEMVVDGKVVGVIAVQASDSLVFAEGSAFVRVANGSMVMTPDRIMALLTSATRKPSLADLAKTIADQSKKIDKLTKELKEAGSFKERMKDYLLGGAIGWAIGMIPQVIDWLMKKP
jgi:predicted HTH transcriptional regulator